MAVMDGDVYVGGFYSMAGGDTVNSIAKWDGNNWSGLDGGVGSVLGPTIKSLAVHDGDLYAAGYFHTAGGVDVKCVAKWNGSEWLWKNKRSTRR